MDREYNSPEENELIAAASRGDQQAFASIVDLYEKLVYNTIKLKVANAEDALDLSQEVFIKLWRSISKYRGDCRFSTWVYKISVNASLDFLRKAAHYQTDPLPSHIDDEGQEKTVEIADESITASPERMLDQSETTKRVQNAICSLSADQRQVIMLRDIDGYTYEEIAEMLEIEIGTVKSRINRARNNLRELLCDYFDKV